MQSYNNLEVTAVARAVIRETYQFTASFPRAEQFGLTAQMRRAAISTGLNIVEGCSRSTTKELIRFLQIAVGSAMELEFALLVADDLGLGSSSDNQSLFQRNSSLQKQLSALIGSLRLRLKNRTRS